MNALLAFAGCGAAGAVTYSFPVYIKSVTKRPPGDYARSYLIFSIFVGSVCAALFTPSIGYHFPWTTTPEPWPLSMVIGLASNPLVPTLLRKIQKWADAFEGPLQ